MAAPSGPPRDRRPNESMAYDASAIEVLTGLEPVRKRPGMYTTTERPNHLAQEVIDNSADEAIAGHCDEIVVTLHDDGSLSVADNGRGMPVDKHAKEGVPGVEVILTRLHAGREVLRQELPLLRRPARRRRLRRQRPLEEAGGVGAARRQRVLHGLRRRQEEARAEGRRAGRQAQHRHDGPLLARREVLRLAEVQRPAAQARHARQGGALPGPAHPLHQRGAIRPTTRSGSTRTASRPT